MAYVQWMPETMNSTKPYIYCMYISYMYIPMIKFKLFLQSEAIIKYLNTSTVIP